MSIQHTIENHFFWIFYLAQSIWKALQKPVEAHFFLETMEKIQYSGIFMICCMIASEVLPEKMPFQQYSRNWR